MKNYCLLLLFFSVLIVSNAQNTKESIQQIDTFLQSEYPKNEPGAVVLISQNGNIIFEKAYGLSSLKPKRKLKTDMVFQIGSMTKQFVSAAILQLVEAGKMSLSDTIQQYVPNYPSKKYPITIHHLLSQTSGIPEYFDVDDNEFYLLAQEHTPQQIIDYYKNEPLIFKPGEKWSYSNSNYPLLGAALENITGMSLKEYLNVHIFDPLGMNSTGLWYRENTSKKHIVTGYNIKDGQLIPAPKMVGSALYAPGGIVSTTHDLFLWNKDFTEKKVLSDFVVEQLITEKKTNGGTGTGYGYGFFLKKVNESPTIQHGGNLFGFTSYGMYLPNEDIFICILSNTKFDRTEELSRYMASVLLGNPIQIYSKKEISKAKLKEYVGTYKLQSDTLKRIFDIKAFDNELLFANPENPSDSALLTPSTNDIFLLKAANATLQFTRDEQQRIDGFIITQKEQYIFKKIK
ncbi:MAG: serine hydrolase domain-containing protein [Bacteroidota bacterium]